MFRALAAWHCALVSLADVAVCADVLVGSCPPLACLANSSLMAW